AVILANGAPPPHEVLQRAIGSSTLFICADGGANAARALGVRPAAIIGDFDSVTPETLEHFADVPQIRDAGEDRTDTEKAIEYVLSKGRFQEITLLGASSGRLDHEMEHVGLMRRYLHRVRIVVESGFGRAYAASKDVKLECHTGTVISFFAIGAPVPGVTTVHLRYALENRTMDLGFQDSISNVVDATPAWIRFKRGTLLVVETTIP
ncbi:MAG TPA: thiamine diphosphokinase, partial [Candidatus Dormibacteraeota bacterium]|nr:thiamine diphosphokinase [Candidatus Dormibacteraeota bacterium]